VWAACVSQPSMEEAVADWDQYYHPGMSASSWKVRRN
jgi:hypothetical protein